MEIRELTTYSPEAFADIAVLMGQLDDRCMFTEKKLKETVEDGGCHLYCMYDASTCSATGAGRIIGCATLCVYHSPTGAKASVEDVVIREEYRGQHLGRQMMEYVLEQARGLAPIAVNLTSNPKRVVANEMYRGLGFERRETNCYRLDL